MTKSVNVAYDADGNPTVSMTELPPAPVAAPASPRKRIPSSPHKPFQSSNFYDLTRSSPETAVKSAADNSIVDLTQSNLSSPEIIVKENSRPRPQTSYNNSQTIEADRRKTVPSPFKSQNSRVSSGFRALQQMDRQNNSNTIPTIPGPYASKDNQKSSSYTSGFNGKKRCSGVLYGINCSLLVYRSERHFASD